MADLEALRKELAEKQAAMEKAQGKHTEAESAYQEEFAKWLTDNSAIAVASDVAEEGAKRAKEEFQSSRKRIAAELESHFMEHPEDKDKVDAFAYRLEKEPLWSCADSERVGELIKANAVFLLQVDEKALSAFVKNNAVKGDEGYYMPHPMRSWLRDLHVTSVYKPTISDKKLKV